MKSTESSGRAYSPTDPRFKRYTNSGVTGICYHDGGIPPLRLSAFIIDNPDLFRGMSILDFGVGSGVNNIALCRAGYPVAGLDREPLFLDMARRVQALNHTTYELHQGSTDELEGLDFDVLTVNQLFYNQERLGDVLDLLDRLPAGKVALLSSDPSWPNDYKGFVKLRKLLGSEATHWSPYIMQVIT